MRVPARDASPPRPTVGSLPHRVSRISERRLFLATRHRQYKAASDVFLLAGSGVPEAHGLRSHMMHDWKLNVRVLTVKGRAERWSVGAAHDSKVVSLPPSLELRKTSVLWAALPGRDYLVNMNDASAWA